jgi:iron complex transport system substrate-binding protein
LARRPRVLSIEWIDPVMIAGTWMPELIEVAGGRPLVTKAGEAARTLGVEELRALKPRPDVVLIKPCGFRLERSLMERERMCELFGTLPWPALKSGDVFLADGNAFFNRPGPRLVDSAEILAAVIHPFDFKDFGQRHTSGYTRLSLR